MDSTRHKHPEDQLITDECELSRIVAHLIVTGRLPSQEAFQRSLTEAAGSLKKEYQAKRRSRNGKKKVA